MCAELEPSWVLEERLKNIDCTSELKKEVNKFITKYHNRCTGKRMSISNIIYRGNLHYIEDTIKDGSICELINELRTFNCA